MKKLLDELEIENFLPMRFDYVKTSAGKKKKMVPAIRNLIFVRTSQAALTELKTTKADFEPLRYMMRKSHSTGQSEIIHVPDTEMNNFMRVASVNDDRVMILDNNDFISKIGKRVEVTEGYFAGVEGVIKRIKRNKHVVVQIDGVAAVAITFVPARCLAFIDNN